MYGCKVTHFQLCRSYLDYGKKSLKYGSSNPIVDCIR